MEGAGIVLIVNPVSPPNGAAMVGAVKVPDSFGVVVVGLVLQSFRVSPVFGGGVVVVGGL